VNRPGSLATTKSLIACGAIGGPLFVFVFLVEGMMRPHYNPLRQPVSDLELGGFGWIQIANFVVTGLLFLAFAVGLRRMLLPLGAVWGPLLLRLFAMGLIGAGIFSGDRSPRLHDICGVPVFFGLPIACFVFSRLFVRLGKRGWAAYSAFTGLAMLATFVLAAMGFGGWQGLVDFAGVFQRLSITIGWTWITLLAIHLLRDRTNHSGQPVLVR
jgi:hypothetical membrane protein